MMITTQVLIDAPCSSERDREVRGRLLRPHVHCRPASPAPSPYAPLRLPTIPLGPSGASPLLPTPRPALGPPPPQVNEANTVARELGDTRGGRGGGAGAGAMAGAKAGRGGEAKGGWVGEKRASRGGDPADFIDALARGGGAEEGELERAGSEGSEEGGGNGDGNGDGDREGETASRGAKRGAATGRALPPAPRNSRASPRERPMTLAERRKAAVAQPKAGSGSGGGGRVISGGAGAPGKGGKVVRSSGYGQQAKTSRAASMSTMDQALLKAEQEAGRAKRSPSLGGSGSGRGLTRSRSASTGGAGRRGTGGSAL